MSETVDLTGGIYRRTFGGFVSSRKMCAIPLESEAMFWRVNAVVDDFGNVLADPLLLRNTLAGYRVELTVKDVERMVGDLVKKELVRWYHIGQDRYLHVNGFLERQPAASRNGKRIQRWPREPEVAAGDGGGEQVQAGAGGDADADDKGEAGEPKGFTRWWDEYPPHERKTGRSKCLAAWKRKKLEKIADQVLAALGRSRRSELWTKESGKFICGPAKWLNDTPWETRPEELGTPAAAVTDSGMERAPVTDEVLRAALGGHQ